MPFEVRQIERTIACRRCSPSLNVPSGREKQFFVQLRVESRAEIKRLTRKAVEAKSIVVTKIAYLGADENAGHHLHRERCPHAERGFPQGLAGRAQPRLFRLKADIESTKRTTRH